MDELDLIGSFIDDNDNLKIFNGKSAFKPNMFGIKNGQKIVLSDFENLQPEDFAKLRIGEG
jgi:hypothetical protein